MSSEGNPDLDMSAYEDSSMGSLPQEGEEYAFSHIFPRPEPGYDSPARQAFIQRCCNEHFRSDTNLDPRKARAPPVAQRIRRDIEAVERYTGQRATDAEARRIRESHAESSGWLQGLKIDLEGKKEVPIAAFNRLAEGMDDAVAWFAGVLAHKAEQTQEQEDMMKHLERQTRTAEEFTEKAKAIIQERDEYVGELTRHVSGVSAQKETLLLRRTVLEQTNKELEDKAENDEQQITDLENEVAYLKSMYDGQTETLLNRRNEVEQLREEQKALEEALDELEAKYKAAMSDLEHCGDEKGKLRSEIAELEDRLQSQDYMGRQNTGSLGDGSHESQENDDKPPKKRKAENAFVRHEVSMTIAKQFQNHRQRIIESAEEGLSLSSTVRKLVSSARQRVLIID